MKKHFILAIILIFTFILSGCSDNDKKVHSDTSTVKTQTQTEKNNLTDLLNEKAPQLKIKIGNGSSFKATQYMVGRILEMFNRTIPAPTADKSEKIECDVKLSFDGFEDIDLNSKTGHFWFDGESTSYTIDSWSDQYFKRIMLKEIDGQVMYDSFEKDILQQNTMTDVDSDGTPDEIKLYYDGDIRMKVKDQDIPVVFGAISNAVSSNVPSCRYACNLSIKGNPNLYQFLIGIEFAFVNKYGSSSIIKSFQYENGQLKEAWSSENELKKEIKVRNLNGNNLEIILGDKLRTMKLDNDEMSYLKDYMNSCKENNTEFNWDNVGFYFPLTIQNVRLDYNNDKVDELVTKTALSSGSIGIKDILFSVYTFTDEGLSLKDLFFASSNNSLEKLFYQE